MQHAFRHRKEARRDQRSLWITRINAATRQNGMSYSQFMHHLKNTEGTVASWNRKSLSEFAISNPEGFKELIKSLKPSEAAA
jgi:large subunit ribosomal protein L20